jgi:hypothetical protein
VTPAELLGALGPWRLAPAPGGALRLYAPPDVRARLGAAIAEHHGLLTAHTRGLTSGHAIAPCGACGQPAIVHVRRRPPPRCRMTPGCAGRHRPRPADTAARARAPAPPKAPAPPPHPRPILLGPWPPWPPWPTTR